MKVTAFLFGKSRGKAILVITVSCLFIFFFFRGVRNSREQIISLELTTGAYRGQVAVLDSAELKKIGEQIARAKNIGPEQIEGNYKLVIKRRKSIQTFLFDNPAKLFEPETGRIMVLPDAGNCLNGALKQLAEKNPYGEFLTWDDVDKIFRKLDKARVVDFEFGDSFVVQRRAGSNHADVQPVTAADTTMLKKIYGGRWSWKRRAIVVEVNGRRLAASMNGMPHGAGAIEGNDFNGHFCVHFRDSKTHSKGEDLAHQLMVWKAAGVVDEMLVKAEPERIITVMLVAMEQGDFNLASRMFAPTPELNETEINRLLNTIKWLAVSGISNSRVKNDTQSFDSKVSFGLRDGTQVSNRRVTFNVIRGTGKIQWKISAQTITQLLGPFKKADETPGLRDESIYHEWNVDYRM
ncbi:MAG: hypothetical protein CVV03_04075 [Firmicutes bacterium HGW-Firmicutes-8]|nr:MAG: hypothetical protein CVV03_04075 [Firmicutes bacterium HGW-Firmicutes-8]